MPRRPGVTTTPLMRIDPRTNRVVARIPINSPGGGSRSGGRRSSPARGSGSIGAMGLVAVDPTRNRPVREIVLGGDFQVDDALGARQRAVGEPGGPLAHAVRRRDRAAPRPRPVERARRLRRVPYGDRIVKVGRRSVALVDPARGRPLWRTRLGTQLNQAPTSPAAGCSSRASTAPARGTRCGSSTRAPAASSATLTVPGFSVNALLDGRPRGVADDGRRPRDRRRTVTARRRAQAGGLAAAASASLPGLNMSAGSSACLIARIIATASAPCSSRRNAALP